MCKLSKEIRADNGVCYNANYTLLKSNSQYGIEVSVKNIQGETIDFIKIENITANALEINCIFMLLYNYEVTPVTVYDVLDTYFADTDYYMNLMKAENLQ